MNKVVLELGWNYSQAIRVAELYEEAFGSKFSQAISSKAARIDFLAKCFVPEYSYVAKLDDDIVGLAGFQTQQGSLTGGMGMKGVIRELGILRGVWATLIFGLFERKPRDRELVMDGIVVDRSRRGHGFGSKLLDKIIDHAAEHGFQTVRLDVIDTNPRARKLYESKGFKATHTQHLHCLKWLLGYSASTTMIFSVNNFN